MRAAAATLAALALLPATAHAQAYQCHLPQGLVSVPAVPRDGPVRHAPVTGYTLALTWSPEFCRTRAGAADNDRQCAGRFGRFGFVVHGLWPEGRGSSWPQWCPARQPLTARELARNLCMTPSEQVVAHEWAKHGACMSASPERYFATARRLWGSLRWPDFDRLSREDGLTAGRVREAFAQANRLWEHDNVGLAITERGWLQGLQLCLDRRLEPAVCDARRFGPADSAPVRIWRGL